MKNKVKIILFLMISLFVFPFATKEVYAYENIDYEPKIYCEINEEYDFALDSVLVMIDKNLSDVNKVFEKTFFVCLFIRFECIFTVFAHILQSLRYT